MEKVSQYQAIKLTQIMKFILLLVIKVTRGNDRRWNMAEEDEK